MGCSGTFVLYFILCFNVEAIRSMHSVEIAMWVDLCQYTAIEVHIVKKYVDTAKSRYIRTNDVGVANY